MRRCLTILAAGVIAFGLGLAGAFDAEAVPPPGKGKKNRAAIIADLVEVDCISHDALSGSTQGTITVGSDEQSCYSYEIAITGAEAGDVFVDSVGAVWDIDGDPGYSVVDDCTVTLSQPASAFKDDPEKRPEQQPEHVTIVMTDVSCTVTVFLKTAGVKNSLVAGVCTDPLKTTEATCTDAETGGLCDDTQWTNKTACEIGDTWTANSWTSPFFALFHPQSCDYLFVDDNPLNGVLDPGEELLDSDGKPMSDWFAVNDGAKGYDQNVGGVLLADRLFSFQLEPLDCDFDGDGVFDADDDCPLVGGEVGLDGCPL